ncbi:MAG: HAD hydrolase family protein, partial [Candidatus Bipolaricaulota bacterium]
ATDYIRRKDGMRATKVDSLKALLDEHGKDPIKLFSIGPRNELERVQTTYHARFPGYTCVFSEHDMLEFLGTGVTKGHALRILCELLELPLAAVAAFGDNLNDLEMIQAAGLGVSMATAPGALRAAADHTTEDLTEFLRATFRSDIQTGDPP